ncbi:MAG TPA: metal-dependent phosphohydrolase [Desulfobulbaceae bacterium]|nr:MAG: metal-dependent phosphohydrolase [Deltaproteobacteria bacterium RIFOXYD12_FULL_53_23]HCC54788.1 metal-dependent phosphohydrolase [Desulfobulbaceae bacterium]
MPSAKDILRKFTELKTLPHVAIKVTQLVNDDRSTMHDFEEIIKLDPVLVTRLLRLVNSPFFGLSQKVGTISKAVVFTGMTQLRNLVAVESLREMFKGDDVDFSAQKLWLHSATVAILSGMIAKRIFGKDSEDIFLAGIIHDIGLIVENQVVGEQLRVACKAFREEQGTLIECERNAIGADHAEVGYLLVKDWGLPLEVLSAIKAHHLSRQIKSVSSPGSILQLAEFMAGKMQYWAIPGPLEKLPLELAAHVKERMADYKIIIRDLPGEMAKAKELYESDE